MAEELSYAEAIRKALKEEMEEDPAVFLMGEDIGQYGGSQKVTEGLIDEFGEDRVIDSPILEASIVGSGAGAAMGGLRPVVEIMYMDFLPIAMEQILNHVTQAHYISAGEIDVPLVIRTQFSIGRVHGPQHSQFFPSWFMNIPGLEVTVPSTPQDAYSLTKESVESDSPVLALESARLYHNVSGEISDQKVPIGKADVKRQGEDVTVVAVSRVLHEALDATEELSNNDISAEVIDPRSLRPLDLETILDSVKKTGRVIVATDEYKLCSSASEIITGIIENLFDELESPPVRVTSPDMHIPFAKSLENAYMIGKSDIVSAAKELIEG